MTAPSWRDRQLATAPPLTEAQQRRLRQILARRPAQVTISTRQGRAS